LEHSSISSPPSLASDDDDVRLSVTMHISKGFLKRPGGQDEMMLDRREHAEGPRPMMIRSYSGPDVGS
jgi:hypothetical protein